MHPKKNSQKENGEQVENLQGLQTKPLRTRTSNDNCSLTPLQTRTEGQKPEFPALKSKHNH